MQIRKPSHTHSTCNKPLCVCLYPCIELQVLVAWAPAPRPWQEDDSTETAGQPHLLRITSAWWICLCHLQLWYFKGATFHSPSIPFQPFCVYTPLLHVINPVCPVCCVSPFCVPSFRTVTAECMKSSNQEETSAYREMLKVGCQCSRTVFSFMEVAHLLSLWWIMLPSWPAAGSVSD